MVPNGSSSLVAAGSSAGMVGKGGMTGAAAGAVCGSSRKGSSGTSLVVAAASRPSERC